MKEDKTVFVVGRWNDDCTMWEVMGIFEDEQKAVENCTAWNDFVGPISLNRALPERAEWPGAYFPIAVKEK